MSKDKVYIIGVGKSGASSLLPEICQLINQAELIFGGERLLDMFPAAQGQRTVIKNNLAEIIEVIKANLGEKQMVVLASGDPNLYGIAKYLTSRLGKDIFEIVPNVSSMQLAFASIKESWDDATLASVHSRPIEDIVETVRSSDKIGIFTDEEHTPAAVARVLLAHGVDGYQAYVCEELGGREEKVTRTDLHRFPDIAAQHFLVLNDLHRPPAEDVGRPDHQGVPDLLGDLEGFLDIPGHPGFRLGDAQVGHDMPEAVPVLREVDDVGGRSDDGQSRIHQLARDVQRRLPTELDDDPLRLLLVIYGQHVLHRQGLEIKLVGGVVIRGDRLGVAVHHDGLVAFLPDREGRVDTAVIELDPLSDAVRSAS